MDASWILQQETDASLFSATTAEVVGSAIDLANSLLANCNTIRSADKYANRITLERYYVESCELSLVRSPGVFTSLLFVSKPEFLINSSECLGSASISIRFGAFPNGGRNPSYHTVQKSFFTRVKELWSRTQCCNVFHE